LPYQAIDRQDLDRDVKGLRLGLSQPGTIRRRDAERFSPMPARRSCAR
jgi:hypothetical protein